MVAVFCLSYGYGGTSIGKYFSKKSEVERVNDVAVLDYTDAILFDDTQYHVDLEASIEETADAEAGFVRSEEIRAYDKNLLLAVTALSILLLWPRLHRAKFAAGVYLILGVYLFSLAYFKSLNGGAAFTALAVFAHATRWLAALALALWMWQSNGRKGNTNPDQPSPLVVGMLVVSAFVTFATHGIEAFMLHPGFVDLLMFGAENLWIHLSEEATHFLLKGIGVMDIALGLIILSQRNRKVLLFMAFWGAMTALSRPMAHGLDLWLESLLRIENFAVPLILAFIYCKKSQQESTSGDRRDTMRETQKPNKQIKLN